MRRALLGLALLAVCGAAIAQPRVGGDYSGQYYCSQGLTGMTVRLGVPRDGAVDATIVFYAHPNNPGVASGCYSASGRVEPDGRVRLAPVAWIHRPGESWSMTVLEGRLAADGAFTGRVIAPTAPSACTTFTMRRGATPFKAPPAQCVREPLVG
jgi:hypothetical protein